MTTAAGKGEVMWDFEVHQDGMIVASGWGPNEYSVCAEANHYAMIYGQDGPVKVVIQTETL